MLIDLSKLLQNEGDSIEISVPLEMNEISFQMGTYPIKKKNPVFVKAVHEKERTLRIEFREELQVEIPCGRCLSPVLVPFELNGEYKVDMKLTGQEREKLLDETEFIQGESLDADILIRNELLTQWPIRVLCKEDCKGICSRCGANLNERDCGCENDSGDPRMAAIKDIFSKFNQ